MPMLKKQKSAVKAFGEPNLLLIVAINLFLVSITRCYYSTCSENRVI